MPTPFRSVTSDCKDTYHFYLSQIRINHQYIFGILVNKWAILHTPISLHISQNTTSMVRDLYYLRNELIDERDVKISNLTTKYSHYIYGKEDCCLLQQTVRDQIRFLKEVTITNAWLTKITGSIRDYYIVSHCKIVENIYFQRITYL